MVWKIIDFKKLQKIILKKVVLFIALSGVFMSINSCCFYSLKAGQLPPEIKTVSLHYIANQAPKVNPALSQIFMDAMRDKFLKESNLKIIDKNGDLDFSGAIVDYTITAVGRSGTQSTGSQLSISVKIDYVNNKNVKEKWSQTFTKTGTFDASQSFTAIENTLANDISKLIVDDIYNKSVVNW